MVAIEPKVVPEARYTIGQTVRVIGTKKSVDVNVANYIKNGMKPQTVCRWLQFLRMVIE